MKEKIVEELGKELKEKKKLPKEEQSKINKKVVSNLLIACLMMLFFIFLALGYTNIKKEIFLTDLKVFAMGILAISIILFENSYQKENGTLCIWGIETLVLAIFTLVSIYICNILGDTYYLILPVMSFVVAIYYTVKSILLYRKMKKEYLKSLSDINEIIKEEEPIKKVETKKRKKVKEMEVAKKTETRQTAAKKTKTSTAKKTEETTSKSKKETSKATTTVEEKKTPKTKKKQTTAKDSKPEEKKRTTRKKKTETVSKTEDIKTKKKSEN